MIPGHAVQPKAIFANCFFHCYRLESFKHTLLSYLCGHHDGYPCQTPSNLLYSLRSLLFDSAKLSIQSRPVFS